MDDVEVFESRFGNLDAFWVPRDDQGGMRSDNQDGMKALGAAGGRA